MIVYVAVDLSISTRNILTMNYSVAEDAVCTCQLDSASPVACKDCILSIHWDKIILGILISGDPGIIFTDITSGEHVVNVTCKSNNRTFSRRLFFTVSGKGVAVNTVKVLICYFCFLSIVQVTVSTSVTRDTVTLILHANTDGTFECSLDGRAFQRCNISKHYVYLYA